MFTRNLIFASLFAASSAMAAESDVIGVIVGGDARSNDWDAIVASAMVGEYDTNGSGAVDNGKEIKAISCTVWAALDQTVKAGWDGTGARAIYGFKKGFIWVGYAWGLDEKMRKLSDKQMAKCGIE